MALQSLYCSNCNEPQSFSCHGWSRESSNARLKRSPLVKTASAKLRSSSPHPSQQSQLERQSSGSRFTCNVEVESFCSKVILRVNRRHSVRVNPPESVLFAYMQRSVANWRKLAEEYREIRSAFNRYKTLAIISLKCQLVH